MITHTELKEALLKKCLDIKEESSRNTQAAMEEAQESANDYGQPKDRYDSYRAQLMRKRDMLAQQFAQIQEELRYLRQIKPTLKVTEPVPGAIVVLNNQKLFISVGIGKIVVENEEFMAVSPVVPLVQAIKKSLKSKKFLFRDKEIEIIEIY